MAAINIVGATNVERLSATEVPVALDRGLSSATDTAKINAMRNGRVLVGNYCGSMAGELLLIKPLALVHTQ